MNKNGLLKKILLVGLLCLMLTYSVWQWTEHRIQFYIGQINSGLERIAQIKNANNDVARNHSGQLLWQSVESGDVLFIGNSLQTEKKSSVEIIFDDGEQLTIGPESLVRFLRTDNKISLELVEGKMEVKSASAEFEKTMRINTEKPKRLVVATPKGRLELNNSDLRLQAKTENAQQSFNIEVVAGAPALVTDTTTEVLELSAPTEKIDVLKDLGEVKKADEPVVTLIKTEEATVPQQREPASQIPLTAPKVKSIKVEAFE